MAAISRDIALNVSKPNTVCKVFAKQGDTLSRTLTVTLCDDEKTITVSPTATVFINVKRSDGEAKAFAGSVNDDGTVNVPINTWMLEVYDIVNASVSIVDGNNKLTSLSFSIIVEPAEYSGADISDDEQDIFVKLIEDCTAATAKAEEASTKIPHIGVNGDWYIGNEDTGKPSRGERGEKGDKGDKGDKGEKGDKGDAANVSELPYATLSLADYDTRKRGHIAADGEYTASGSWFSYYFYTDKHPIKKINAKLFSNSTAAYSIAFYSGKDSIASNFISGVKPTAAGANLISFDDISVPENAVLIVVSTRFASGENSSAELFVNLNIPAAEMPNIGDTGSEKTGQIKRIFTDFPNANDFTFVQGELWGSGASGDTTVIKRYRITDDGLLLLGIIKTDFGHLNTFDYNPANDCLIFGNGANDFSTEGNWFAVVKNPMGLVTSEYSATATLAANAIVYNVDIGYKVQAVWGASNLGLNNIVYLLSNNAKTVTKVLLNVDDNGEFNGQFTVLDTHTSETAYPVGGAKFWGDTLYFGYSDTGYKIAKMSMSDYSVSVTKRQLYYIDGTEISGTVQGLHIDDKYVWVFINAVNPIRSYLIQMYQCLGSLSSGSGGAGTTITVDAELSATSENPVQNKAIKAALDKKIDEPTSNGLVRKYMSGIYGTVGIDAEMPASPTDNSVPSTKLLKEKLKNALGLSDADLKKSGLLLQTYQAAGSTPGTVGVTGYTLVQRDGSTLDDTITGMAKIPSSYGVGKYVKEKTAATTPSINESGNWVIGTEDTGVSAKGIKGDTGAKGDKGDTGAKGADGKTPVKGTDYFTEADKQELVNAVIAALPNGNGVAY